MIPASLPLPLKQSLAEVIRQCQLLCEENGNGSRQGSLRRSADDVRPPQVDQLLLPNVLPGDEEISGETAVEEKVLQTDACKDGKPLIQDRRSFSKMKLDADEIRKRLHMRNSPEKAQPAQNHQVPFTFAATKVSMLQSQRTRSHDYNEERAGILGVKDGFMETMALLRISRAGSVKVTGPITLARYIDSTIVFQVLCIWAVMINVVVEGLSADHRVKQAFHRLHGRDYEGEWLAIDIAFICYFSMELLVKTLANLEDLLAQRCREWKWLVFDLALIVSAGLEYAIEQKPSFAPLRVLRVFRLLRLVRVVKACKFLKSFRTMVFAVLNSLVSLFWALFMLCWVVFVFAIMFAGAVAGYYDDVDVTNDQVQSDAQDVEEYFGSMYDICTSLYAAISGGNDYMTYAQPLKFLGSDLWFIVFLMYIGFCFMGLLNVITGIFVDSAVSTRTRDEVVQTWKDEQQSISREVKRIFRIADVDKSGTLTLAELQAELANPWVRAYFSGLELDPDEVSIIFSLIDKDCSGEIYVEEFVDGIVKLKGSARAVDLVALMHDQAIYGEKFTHLFGLVEDGLKELKNSIAPNNKEMPRVP